MFTPLSKLLCIFCLSFGLVLATHQITHSVESPNAAGLTLQGHSALELGDYPRAIALFKQAEALYEEEGNEEGIIGTQVNQAIALDHAGHKRRACKQLSQTLSISGVCDAYGLEEISVDHTIDNPPAIIGLQALSNLLINFGHLEEAEKVIKELMTLAPDEPSGVFAQLSLKNAEAAMILNRQKLSTQAITSDNLTTLQDTINQSDRLLSQLIDAPNPIRLPAIINTLKTEALIHQSRLDIEQIDKNDLYHTYLSPEQIQALDNRNQFKALASSIESLIQLKGKQQHVEALLESAKHSATAQRERAKLALLQGQFLEAQNANSKRIESFYQKAAQLAMLAHDPIIAYTSYHHLALLHTHTPEQKIAFFQQAIAQLEEAKSTLAITPSLLPKLEYDIQSIFHDYMGALSRQGQPIGPIHSTMKRWRIDTYLRCSNYTVSEDLTQNNDEAIIHITLLDNAIVTSIQKNGTERQYFADKELALSAIHQLMHELAPSNATPDLTALKTASQQTYDWLLKTAIQDNFMPGDTLHFNVDPALESLPMAALFNGEQERFLIEEFPITYSTELTQTQHHSNSPIALIGSMSTQNPNHPFSLRFPPLPEVELEARTIESILNRVYSLNNERFTLDNFKETLQEEQPSIVHIATHGLFSANPRDTALVAWDRSIHPQTLGQLLRNSPLQLLVLSSCETAQGGRLGIAGLALQSGAQNTIASLSLVDSRATFLLMSEFYRYLDNGQSVEQSLQMAQKTLLNSSLFHHPAYWSPFILISS